MATDAEIARKREVRRQKLLKAAQLRAEINFRHAVERVNHRIDVVEPALKEFDTAIEEGKTLEIEGV